MRAFNFSQSASTLAGSSCIIFLFTSLLAITLLNVICAYRNIVQLERLLPTTTKEYTFQGSDYPAQLPLHMPDVGMPLDSSEDHFSLFDDEEWGTQFPGDGFTDLGPSQRPFIIAMFHQMHCLDVIRVGYVTNRTGSAHHITHCLRYLRQTVLCKADTTLEETHFKHTGDEWRAGSNGVGMVHRCRDWTAVFKYLREFPSKHAVMHEDPAGRWLHSDDEKKRSSDS